MLLRPGKDSTWTPREGRILNNARAVVTRFSAFPHTRDNIALPYQATPQSSIPEQDDKPELLLIRDQLHSEPVNKNLFQNSNFASLPATGTCLSSLPISIISGSSQLLANRLAHWRRVALLNDHAFQAIDNDIGIRSMIGNRALRCPSASPPTTSNIFDSMLLRGVLISASRLSDGMTGQTMAKT